MEATLPRTASTHHVRWNYVVHILDGGLFKGSQALLNANTVLPAAVAALGGPPWLIGLMPIAMLVGITCPPLFVAHIIDRLDRYRPLLLVTGILQRLPYLLAGLVLLSGFGGRLTMLAAVAGTPLVAGLFCGVGLCAWQQLFADTLPAHRRSSALAGRNLVGSLMGLAAGWWIKITLENSPGASGYAKLHLYSFLVLCVSYGFFAMVRESRDRSASCTHHHSLLANLRSVPALMRGTPGLGLFLLANALLAGLFVAAPFLVIHFKAVLGKPESWVGKTVVAQMAGAVLGNIAAGWAGDRRGGKTVLLMSQLALILCLILALVSPADLTAFFAFFAFGFSFTTRHVGGMTLSLDIVPDRQRGTALACIGLVNLVSMIAASVTGTVLYGHRQVFARPALCSLILAVLTLVCLFALPEPRQSTGTLPEE